MGSRNSSMTRQFLAEQEIRSLLVRERFYRDTFQWENLRNSYHPDASKTSIDVSWFQGNINEFVTRSIDMTKGGTRSFHTISPVQVRFSKSKAFAESTGSVTIRLSVDGIEYDCVSWVRFLTNLQLVDRAASRPEWRLVSLDVIYDRDSLSLTCPQTAAVQNIDVNGGRESYKYLTWALSKRGFTVNTDLAGTDSQGSVNRAVELHEKWLHN